MVAKTKAEEKYEEILSTLSTDEKNHIILECMRILDAPEPWDSSSIEQIAERFTLRGFIIRDCNDESQYEECELED